MRYLIQETRIFETIQCVLRAHRQMPLPNFGHLTSRSAVLRRDVGEVEEHARPIFSLLHAEATVLYDIPYGEK